VIVLDRMMPRLNGLDVLKKLKADERFKSIPVVMQTAAASSRQIEEGIQAGVYYYLTKPYDERLLLSIVRAAVRDRLSQLEAIQQVAQQRRTLGLMEKSRFRFRTLEEANNLSYFIANCFPQPDVVVHGLGELMINAIEHGNLGISYDEKSELIYSAQWHEEVEKRLGMPQYREKYAVLEFTAAPDALTVKITDQGPGFDWQNYLDFSPDRAMDPHGRGIAVAKAKSFDAMEFIGSGNEVVCKVKR
ncbi:MAG: response regulator, partial [Alphaproteobacteria bacterium]|nr:response regulator [Alphaproteobacteria bacterium]